MKNILISGLLNIETTLKIREFPIKYYPIDYPFFGVNSSVSGVAVNIAKAEKALGNEVSILSMIGKDDEGERIIKDMERENIRTDYIIKELEQTPASVVLFDPEGRRQIYCDLKDIQEKDYNINEVKSALESCDVAVICNINFNRGLLKAAKDMGKLIATDVHVLGDIEDEYNKDFMSAADILFLSDESIKGDPKLFLEKLKDKYSVKIIVLGRGKKGAMLYIRSEDAFYNMKSVTVGDVVNTVGAGDALFSSFIHYYVKGFEPIEALKRAQLFASYKIGFNGAATGFLNEKQLEEWYSKTEFEYTII